MKCVEFESRLNCLLDERLLPSIDQSLARHAEHCPRCSNLLAAHEALWEGVTALPEVRLGVGEQQALAHRIALEVGNTPKDAFRPIAEMDLARPGAMEVATRTFAPPAIIGTIVAIAAALLIAMLLSLPEDQQQVAPSEQPQRIVDSNGLPLRESVGPATGEHEFGDLALIARVGYEVADGLMPVTNSMVSAYRELRKHPFFKGADDPQRSSFLAPPMDELLA